MWTINGINYNITPAHKAQVLIDTCAELGFDIPRFCYHENLKIAGNCRMCLIEDAKSPKPVISCASNVANDMNIFTNTAQVKKARESVMEFLLINHPLDCPICDQGGECDLQDLSLVYGSDRGRFYDYKRNVEDKNCGAVVKTVMNRCILCTRCVRSAMDVANMPVLGLTGRGGKMEIGSYIERSLDSELSGNLVDVCPVGALTLKPYSFASRPWELKRFNTYISVDEQPQLIRVDIKENAIVRIMPSKNLDSHNIWITNRTRLSYEGVARNRLLSPSVFQVEVDWTTLFVLFKALVNNLVSNSKDQVSVTFSSSPTGADYSDLASLKHLATAAALDISSNFSLFSSSSYTFLPISIPLDVTTATNKLVIAAGFNLQLQSPIFAVMINQIIDKISGFISWRSVVGFTHNKIHNCTTGLSLFLSFLSGKTWLNSAYPLPVSPYFITAQHPILFRLLTNFHTLAQLPSATLVISDAGSRAKSELSLQLKAPHSVSTSSLMINSSQSSALTDTFSLINLDMFSHNAENSDSLIAPILTPFEKPNIYYDLHYNLHKGSKVLNPLAGRSVSSIARVLSFALGGSTNGFKESTTASYCRNLSLPLNFMIIPRLWLNPLTGISKSESLREYYGANSLVQNSSTLTKIFNNTPLLSIY